jgi:hypothetical protein
VKNGICRLERGQNVCCSIQIQFQIQLPSSEPILRSRIARAGLGWFNSLLYSERAGNDVQVGYKAATVQTELEETRGSGGALR